VSEWVICLTRTGFKHKIYHTSGIHANLNTTDVVSESIFFKSNSVFLDPLES
jgi:hypothetical protein